VKHSSLICSRVSKEEKCLITLTPMMQILNFGRAHSMGQLLALLANIWLARKKLDREKDSTFFGTESVMKEKVL